MRARIFFDLLSLQAESLKGLKCECDAMPAPGIGVPLAGNNLTAECLIWKRMGVVTMPFLGRVS